jgi:large subunit ribosomal protein L32e
MKFARRSTFKFSRMGRGRRKLQRWRAAVGRHSKVRKNRFGYIRSVRIGFKSSRSESGKIDGKMPVLIRNMNDLAKTGKENVLIIARTVGAKKRIEMIKKANEIGLAILNIGGKKHGPK